MADPMTEARLDEISALADAATLDLYPNARTTVRELVAEVRRARAAENTVGAYSASWVAELTVAKEELEAKVASLEAGALAHRALLEAARDALSAAGINQAHGGDTWPRIDDSIEELAKQRDEARALLAAKEA